MKENWMNTLVDLLDEYLKLKEENKLQERVKELEEMIGCLMRKYKMMKVYKWDRLIYSLIK